MNAFAKYYHRDKNPDQKYIPGVALAHHTAAEWNALPQHLRDSAEAAGFYHDTAPDVPAAPGTEGGGTLPPAAINQVVQAAVQAAVKAGLAPPPAQPAAPPAVTPPPTPEKEPVSNG